MSPTGRAGAAVHHRISHCRACGAEALEPVLDLGLQPLANALPADPAEFADEAAYPLVLTICRQCGLVQLVDVIDPEVLFGHYLYVTGTSSTIAEHNRGYALAVRDALALGPRVAGGRGRQQRRLPVGMLP